MGLMDDLMVFNGWFNGGFTGFNGGFTGFNGGIMVGFNGI